jgi:hypothetical protein
LSDVDCALLIMIFIYVFRDFRTNRLRCTAGKKE